MPIFSSISTIAQRDKGRYETDEINSTVGINEQNPEILRKMVDQTDQSDG